MRTEFEIGDLIEFVSKKDSSYYSCYSKIEYSKYGVGLIVSKERDFHWQDYEIKKTKKGKLRKYPITKSKKINYTEYKICWSGLNGKITTVRSYGDKKIKKVDLNSVC